MSACSGDPSTPDEPEAAAVAPSEAAVPEALVLEPPPEIEPADEADLAAIRLRRKAERVAAQLRAQKRPAPIRVSGATTRWQPGTSYSGYFADPDIVRVGDRWLAYATNTAGLKLPTLTSGDLATWRPVTDSAGNKYDALPRVGDWVRPNSRGKGLWAPGVAKVGKGWTAAYSAQYAVVGGERNNCIGLSRADSPTGPFQHLGEPLVCAPQSRQGLIDPDIYLDPDGKPWLLWKFSGIHRVRPAGIFTRQLNQQGTGWAAGSETREILTLDLGTWEGNTIENPSMITFRGVTYLFYSANAYRKAAYATGYAICEGPQGPCVRGSNKPLLSTATTGYPGPGGADAFSFDNSLRLAYHAWVPGQVDQLRNLKIAGLFQKPDLTLELVDAG